MGRQHGSIPGRLAPKGTSQFATKGVRTAILDGEVVALDDGGRADFGALLRGEGRLHYVAFDVLWLNGRDLRDQPLWRRQRRLARLIPATTPLLSGVLVVPKDGNELFRAAQQLDLEGIVAKRNADPYNTGATRTIPVSPRALLRTLPRSLVQPPSRLVHEEFLHIR